MGILLGQWFQLRNSLVQRNSQEAIQNNFFSFLFFFFYDAWTITMSSVTNSLCYIYSFQTVDFQLFFCFFLNFLFFFSFFKRNAVSYFFVLFCNCYVMFVYYVNKCIRFIYLIRFLSSFIYLRGKRNKISFLKTI